MGAPAIEAHDLAKRYVLGENGDLSGTFADALTRRFGRRQARATLPREEHWALRGVSFGIGEGDVVGLIGRNGAGKSTLLKILARITDPTSGRARTYGQVGALLEVGTAFHLELTGRENIEINGALLGMSRRDIRRRFDEIVEFAGIGRFLDTPLKRYSSGMYLRLAFAVAAHFEPDIVVVDEVLAVGDVDFQRRCLGKMSDLGAEGRTVLFVSHDLGAIGQLCQRVLWLEDGVITRDGPAHEVLSEYLRSGAPTAHAAQLTVDGRAPAGVTEVALVRRDGRPIEMLLRGDPFNVRLAVETRQPTLGLEIAVWIVDDKGLRILDEGLFDDADLTGSLDAEGRYEVVLELPPILPAGEHSLGVWVGSGPDGVLFDRDVLRFSVLPQVGDRDEMAIRRRAAGPVTRWKVEAESQ